MLITTDLETIFDKAIEDKFQYRMEIIRFLKTHERKQFVIEKIKEQIKLVEWTNPRLMTGPKRQKFIQDMAIMFAQAALEHKRQSLLTQGERNLMIREADKIKRAEDMVEQLEKESQEGVKAFMIDSFGGDYAISKKE